MIQSKGDLFFVPNRGRTFRLNPDFTRLFEFIPQFIAFHNACLFEKHEKESSVAAKSYNLLKFLHWMQDVVGQNLGPNQLDKVQLVGYFVWLRDTLELKPASRLAHFNGLHSFFEWLVDGQKIKRNPFQLMLAPKKPQQLPKPVSREGIEAIMRRPDLKKATGRRDLAILEILYGSGLRINECLSLRFRDIEREESGLGPQARVLGKGSKPRIVPLSQRSMEALDSYLELRGPGRPHDFIFLNRFGTNRLTTTGFGAKFRRYRKGVENESATPHKFRHSFATHLLYNDCDILTIKELLGHEELTSTEIYAKVEISVLHDEYNRVDHREKLNEVIAKLPPKTPPSGGLGLI